MARQVRRPFSRLRGYLELGAQPGGNSSAVGPLIARFDRGNPQHTPRRYDRLADEAYAKNVIGYLCIDLIAAAVASLRFMLFRGEQEIEQHPILDLLRKQNPMRRGPDWWHELVSFHQLSGNAYVEAVSATSVTPSAIEQLELNVPSSSQKPVELWNLRPDRIKIIPGELGLPAAYEYEATGGKRRFMVDPVKGPVGLLHIKNFHPLSDWYGFSPVEAAAISIDQDNAASDLNLSMLQNGASPSGLAVFKAQLAADQIAAAEQKIQQKMGGPHNAGRIIVLGGDWDFKRVGDNMRDLQWSEGMDHAARRICAAWNVPHVLVVPGESTFNNRADARVEFWEHTILPYVDRLLGNLNPWLQAWFGDELELRYDRLAISALLPRRIEARKEAREDYKVGIITKNEVRAEIDYGEVEGGDDFVELQQNAPAQANMQMQHDLGEQRADGAHRRSIEAGDRQLERDLKRGEVQSARQRIDATTARTRQLEDGELGHRRNIELQDRNLRRQGSRKAEDDGDLLDGEGSKAAGAGGDGGARRVQRDRHGRWTGPGLSKPPAPNANSPARRAAATRRANAEARRQGIDPAGSAVGNGAEDGVKPLTTAQRAWLARQQRRDEPVDQGARKGADAPPAAVGGDARSRLAERQAARSKERTAQILAAPALTDPPSAWAKYLEDIDAMGLVEAEQATVDLLIDAYEALLAGLGFDLPFFDVEDDAFAEAMGQATVEEEQDDSADRQEAESKADDDPPPFDGDLPEEPLVGRMVPVIKRVFKHFADKVFGAINVEISFDVRDPGLEDYLTKFGAERIKELVGTTTRKELGAALAKVQNEGPTFPKLVAAVRDVFKAAGEDRAQVIARTETTIAAGAATQRAIEMTNTERKMWLSARDSFVRPTHQKLDGEIKASGEPFMIDGYSAMAPGGFAKASLSVNCRCILIPLPDEKAATALDTKDARDEEWKRQERDLATFEDELAAAVRQGFIDQGEAVIASLSKKLELSDALP